MKIEEQFKEKIRTAESLKEVNIDFSVDTRWVVTLKGQVEKWQQVVEAGHIAGKLPGIKGVVNRLTSQDYLSPPKKTDGEIQCGRDKGKIDACDILIIGGGITGSGIARTLSKYNQRIIVVEKCCDISEGTSKSNNGMIHSGYDSKAGSLKAELNVLGNALYTQWQEELGFKMNRCGSFVISLDESDDKYLETYYELGKKNAVPGIEILDGDLAREIEPALSPEVRRALWTPSAAYVEPYEVVKALMENAIDNGVTLRLNTEVLAVDLNGDSGAAVITDRGMIQARFIINAAGLYADDIAEMVGDRFYTIHPRRGSLVVMDKKLASVANKAFIGTPPKNFTKGGGPTLSPEGNPLWGPSAIEVPDKDNTEVDESDLRSIMEKGKHLTMGISEKDIITFFSGCRASDYMEDFIIEASEVIPNFIHVAAIQSPGLASSPAISKRVEEIYLGLDPKAKLRKDYNPIRKSEKAFRDCNLEGKETLISKNPLYGHVVCRCETVTEAEILNAIHGKIPALTVDAVKRRTRAGMGRCQSGFCGPRVVEIIARELGITPDAVVKNEHYSKILAAPSRKEVKDKCDD